MSDEKNVVICGARCVYKKEGECTWKGLKGVVAIIGVDGQCVPFEPAEKK